MRYLKIHARKENRYSLLNAEKTGVSHMTSCLYMRMKKKINILLSVFSIVSFFFYDFNLNTQGFVYLEFVKYQLGLHRNVQGFAKCSVCISANSCFIYRHVQAFYL